MRGSLDHCVKCTICETACPVSNATPLFPGPKYVGPQAERFRVWDEASPDASLDYCSGCGVCTQVCPQGVHIAEINTQARAKMREHTGLKFRDRLLARPDVLGRLATPVAPLANFTLRSKTLRTLGERLVGLDRRPGSPPTRARRCRAGRASTRRRRRARTRRVLPRLRRQLVGAAASARRRSSCSSGCGCQVDVPRGQLCCGLPAQSNGQFDLARKYTRRMAGVLAPSARAGVDIVGTSPSCTLMLKREAREILGLEDDGDLRVGVGPHVRHLRVPACCCSTAASCGPTSSRCRSRSPTTLPASSRATASASRRST